MRARLLTVALALFVVAPASTLVAAEWESKLFEDQCTTGTLRACASVRVETQWDAVAGVTRVRMYVANLQGTALADDTGGYLITRIGLTAPAIEGATADGALVTTEGDVDVIGDPGAEWAIQNDPIGGQVQFSADIQGVDAGGIQGCDLSGAGEKDRFVTCGDDGWVVFNFTTTNMWSASEAQIAWGGQSAAVDDDWSDQCRSDTPGSCEVVPEPLTMVLLGTGLAGVGGAAARRRRRLGGAEQDEV